MKNLTKRNYTKINNYILKLGGIMLEEPGNYLVEGYTVDMSSSGDESWQITKNILRQVREKK